MPVMVGWFMDGAVEFHEVGGVVLFGLLVWMWLRFPFRAVSAADKLPRHSERVNKP